jgi:hypothetical protein
MIELTQIEIEIGYGDDCELVEITRGEVLELITSLRESERDAGRYRWLRDVGQHKYYVDDILGCILYGADGSVDHHMNRNDDE